MLNNLHGFLYDVIFIAIKRVVKSERYAISTYISVGDMNGIGSMYCIT